MIKHLQNASFKAWEHFTTCDSCKIAVYLFLIFMMVASLLIMGGCAGFTPTKDTKTFWDQQVATTAWGFTMMTPYGPFNLGYLSWQRNIEKPQPLEAPGSVLERLKPDQATKP
jgi:hypothetical protein